MNSFMSWVGGKKALRDIIVNSFPLCYERYIEVFGGGGWVLFRKPPMNDFEVYNDMNSHLVNLYQCVREHPYELKNELEYVLNSREDFNKTLKIFEHPESVENIKRAALFYQLIKYSYASSLDSYGCRPHSLWSDFPIIYQASARLQRVLIENKDFESLIKQYDRPVSFFYCDPPYFATEKYYSNVGFGRTDHERLSNVLLNIKGKFLLSYNDCEEIRELYRKDGIYIREVERLNNIKQRYDSGSKYAELLISNYDTYEREKAQKQLCFFDDYFN